VDHWTSTNSNSGLKLRPGFVVYSILNASSWLKLSLGSYCMEKAGDHRRTRYRAAAGKTRLHGKSYKGITVFDEAG